MGGDCVPTARKPRILLTNDDGYQAEGLRALAEEFREFAHVDIVAPSWERSGAAQSLTLRQPIICHRIAEYEWAIDGTPADCVIVGLHKLLHEPGIAMSLCSKRFNSDFKPSARLARRTAELLLKEGIPKQVLLNVNVPENWNGSVRFTRQSKKITRTVLREGEDPRGLAYFWLSEQRMNSGQDVDAESDYAAIFANEVSVTPLHLDPTHAESLNHLSHWVPFLANPILAK